MRLSAGAQLGHVVDVDRRRVDRAFRVDKAATKLVRYAARFRGPRVVCARLKETDLDQAIDSVGFRFLFFFSRFLGRLSRGFGFPKHDFVLVVLGCFAWRTAAACYVLRQLRKQLARYFGLL